jgi:hypothetical protein
MKTVLDKHRSGIIVKQVAAGREFQGCPFYSKPDVIHFKVSYHHKVADTNKLGKDVPSMVNLMSSILRLVMSLLW